jgi:hypothetical protein
MIVGPPVGLSCLLAAICFLLAIVAAYVGPALGMPWLLFVPMAIFVVASRLLSRKNTREDHENDN